ncbi:hypothetical protein [Homoserinimonas hongtaonis]|uniref:hypothetical protein n=1 Tax=Homoserinimonas hongtaonis TaxID=2079791 RepID=UPI0013049EA0|nr:hypothetical protein [Salinibacterium hongtaonis]
MPVGIHAWARSRKWVARVVSGQLLHHNPSGSAEFGHSREKLKTILRQPVSRAND